MKKRAKKDKWFIKVRGSYLPASWQGWATYVPFIAFLVASLMHASDGKHSAGAVFFQLFPQWVAAAVVMTWLAARKS